jgi:tryptophan synthase alpha chain
MSRANARFAALHARIARGDFAADPGLVPFVMAGDGGVAATLDVLAGLEAGGAAAIELGLAHTDPIADGPIVRAAGERALAAGVGFDAYVELVTEHRRRGGAAPLVAFGYTNVLVEARGEPGLALLAAAGVDALAVADLPPEEAESVSASCARCGLALVAFVSPTTTQARCRAAVRFGSAFTYAVARRGTTGRATAVDADLARRLRELRELAPPALAVGFGLGRRDQVAALAGAADLVVVGSALVEHLEAARRDGVVGHALAERARDLLRELSGQVGRPPRAHGAHGAQGVHHDPRDERPDQPAPRPTPPLRRLP